MTAQPYDCPDNCPGCNATGAIGECSPPERAEAYDHVLTEPMSREATEALRERLATGNVARRTVRPSPEDTARTLSGALDYLRAHGWTRGRMTRDGAVCAAEAIAAVTPNRPHRQVSPEERAAIRALAQHITPPPADPDDPLAMLPGSQVTAWNDACQDVSEVEDGFRRAITHLQP